MSFIVKVLQNEDFYRGQSIIDISRYYSEFYKQGTIQSIDYCKNGTILYYIKYNDGSDNFVSQSFIITKEKYEKIVKKIKKNKIGKFNNIHYQSI
jgi:hypothetical protein